MRQTRRIQSLRFKAASNNGQALWNTTAFLAHMAGRGIRLPKRKLMQAIDNGALRKQTRTGARLTTNFFDPKQADYNFKRLMKIQKQWIPKSPKGVFAARIERAKKIPIALKPRRFSRSRSDYVSASELARHLDGMGILIVSTRIYALIDAGELVPDCIEPKQKTHLLLFDRKRLPKLEEFFGQLATRQNKIKRGTIPSNKSKAITA